MRHTFKHTWAEYYTIDSDGNRFEFERKPHVSGNTWSANGGSCSFIGKGSVDDWKNSLQQKTSVTLSEINYETQEHKTEIEVGEKYKKFPFKGSDSFKVLAIDGSSLWVKHASGAYGTINTEYLSVCKYNPEREDFVERTLFLDGMTRNTAEYLYDAGCRFINITDQ